MSVSPSVESERVSTPGPLARSRPGIGRGRKLFLAFLSLYPLVVLGLSLVNWLAPQRRGPLALTEVLAPFLFLPLLVLVPFLLLRGAGVLRVMLLLCAVVYGVRFFPHVAFSAPQEDPAAFHINVMSWNVYAGNGQVEGLQELLRSKPADVVALPEFGGKWVADDEVLRRQYPYQLTYPNACLPGIVLLSAYPVLEQNPFEAKVPFNQMLPMCWARLDLGNGRTMVVMGAHPGSPDIVPRACLRLSADCYKTADRDAQIATIRQSVARFLQAGEPLLFVGDFNTTEREPAYGDLVAGLQDTYRTVGSGNGSTWTQFRLLRLGIPLLRIDYLMASPNIRPISMTTDCAPNGSDHCINKGRFELK